MKPRPALTGYPPVPLSLSRQIPTTSGRPRPLVWSLCSPHHPRALAPLRVLSRTYIAESARSTNFRIGIPGNPFPPSSPSRVLDVDSPNMDADIHSQKRRYSPVSPSEWTDTDESERTRQRLDGQHSSPPTTLDDNIRDRSRHRTTISDNGSSSDGSGDGF